MPKTLIVPVDGSESSERALAVAELLAGHFDRCDTVVMTAARHDDEVRHRYFDGLAERLGHADLRTEFVDAVDAAAAIADLALAEPDAVVCMATHGRGRLAAPLLGSVATEVLRRVESPVLLVGPHCEAGWWHDRPRVLTCWIGGGSNAILPAAKEWVEALHGELWLELVYHPLDTRTAVDPHAEFAPALKLIGDDVDVHLMPCASHYPAGAIVRSAHELPATLVAMTTHARTGLGRSALGSVAMDVVHHSRCPVLVVRTS
jgi:nucleotide-binding universal stress UspA family protein